MKKAIFIITVCILSCVAWVVYSHDDQSGCYNTYQCRAVHATLTCHDFGAYGEAFVSELDVDNNAVVHDSLSVGVKAWLNELDVDNNVLVHDTLTTLVLMVNGHNVLNELLAVADDLDTHLNADEILDCGDVEGCYFKSGTSAGTSIQCTGQGALSKGMAIVPFDEAFASSVDATKPIIVLVTPTDAACKGIAVVKTGINDQIEGKTVSGFCAVELNGGESSSTFNWQALGTRK